MLHKCLATECKSFMVSNSRRITDKITTLIYETQEECNEVKKNKRKRERERKKQALHCDRQYAAVIELDLRKFKKTSQSPITIIHSTASDASLL